MCLAISDAESKRNQPVRVLGVVAAGFTKSFRDRVVTFEIANHALSVVLDLATVGRMVGVCAEKEFEQ
jgi:hypothetical protein